jgi:hypothetical protein
MTPAWRMYVWAGKPVGREYTWLEGNSRRGRGGRGGKKNQGPQSQKSFQSIERGEQNKNRFVPAVLPRGREWIKCCLPGSLSPLAIETPKDLDDFEDSGPDDRRRGSDEVRRRGGVRVGQTRSSRLQTAQIAVARRSYTIAQGSGSVNCVRTRGSRGGVWEASYGLLDTRRRVS